MSPTSYADEFEYPTEGTFDTTKSLDLFVNNQLYLESSTFGTVSDSSDVYSLDLEVYSVPFNYNTYNSFSTSSNIGFSKLFTKTQLSNYLSGKSISSSANIDTLFQKTYGYKLILKYEDENGNTNPLPKGAKVDLDLLLNDYALGGANYYAVVQYTNGSFAGYASYTTYNPTENINLLEFTADDFKSGNNQNGYILFDNHISVYGTAEDGSQISIGEFDNIENLLVNLEVPQELTDITVDVSYNANDSYLNVVSGTGNSFFIVPLFYITDISGTIALDDSGVVTGLIEGIIEWLKSILNAILELPQNIANKVKDVIVSLFVPTSEGLSASFDGLKNMAESKLGFVYTGFSMVYSLLESIVNGVVEPMDTLTLPRLVIPFRHIEGGEFVLWDDMTFDIVPQGMEVLQNLSKLVTSLVLVWLTMRRCLTYFKDFFSKE